MKFLTYDSPLLSAVGKIVDYILLGILWIFACLPVITFGASTTAMLLTAEICLRKEEGKIIKTFCKYFKQEFKQATILWIIQLPVLAILACNIWMLSTDLLAGFFRIVICIASFVVTSWIQLWLAYLSKFEDGLKTVLVNTFRITMSNLGITSLMSLVIFAAFAMAGVVFLLMPPLLVLVPGVFIMSYTAIMRRLFDKFIIKDDTAALDTVTEEV